MAYFAYGPKQQMHQQSWSVCWVSFDSDFSTAKLPTSNSCDLLRGQLAIIVLRQHSILVESAQGSHRNAFLSTMTLLCYEASFCRISARGIHGGMEVWQLWLSQNTEELPEDNQNDMVDAKAVDIYCLVGSLAQIPLKDRRWRTVLSVREGCLIWQYQCLY